MPLKSGTNEGNEASLAEVGLFPSQKLTICFSGAFLHVLCKSKNLK